VSAAAPLHPDIGVLSVSPRDWSRYWGRRHHVVSRLARHFRIAWVTEARHWRAALPWAATPDEHRDEPPVPPNMIRYDSVVGLPTVWHPGWVTRLHFSCRVKHAQRELRRQGCSRLVLFLWRPEFDGVVERGAFDLTCYHIDDEYSFSSDETALDPGEARLIAEVDQVFICSPGLFERKGHLNPHTEVSPNGVDYARHAGEAPEPVDLHRIPRPRIGYPGVLKSTLEWQLVRTLAARRRDWSFVFVGPVNSEPHVPEMTAELAQLGNVHILPGTSADDAARYPRHFDVCVMPYRADTHSTPYGYPLKLHEYLASGRPTVGSPLRTLEDFTDVVTLASSPEEWEAAIAAGLAPAANEPGACDARRAVARRHDWDRLVERLAEVTLRRLAEVASSSPHA
jgi:glycosyltransferase involved in cell wall biosynthesis